MKQQQPSDTPPRAARLTGKQRAFVTAYLSNGFNGRQAAIIAGYSEASAAEIASENLRKPHIAAAIEACLDEAGLGRQWVIGQLAAIARGNICDVLDWKGGVIRIRDLSELTPEQASMIESIEQQFNSDGKAIGIKVKLHNRLAALSMLARALKIGMKDVTIDSGRGPIQVVIEGRDAKVL